jgi:hypothetical protein
MIPASEHPKTKLRNKNGSLFIWGPGENCNTSNGAGGRIRLEVFQNNFNGRADGDLRSGSPSATFIPDATAPSVKVLTVDNVAVNPYPNGSLTLPDVKINAANAVPVTIEADNIPAGTVIHMQVFSDTNSLSLNHKQQ